MNNTKLQPILHRLRDYGGQIGQTFAVDRRMGLRILARSDPQHSGLRNLAI